MRRLLIKSKKNERRDLRQIAILMILFALFCAVFEQIGTSITLFIDRAVDRTLFDDFIIPTPFFQSLNPALIIALGPFIASLWSKLNLKNHAIGVFEKFAIGFLFIGLSFLLLSIIINENSSALLSPLWMVAIFLLQVIGEICIIPIGFSAISTLAPKRFSGLVMGIWMMSIACGHYLAALLANFSSLFIHKEDNLIQSLIIYKSFFLQISFIPFTIVLIITISMLLRKKLNK